VEGLFGKPSESSLVCFGKTLAPSQKGVLSVNVQAYQQRNLLWIASLVTAFTILASIHPKTQKSISQQTPATYQTSTR
jgi:hypothetical protein